MKAFLEIKEQLKCATLLAHPIPDTELSLVVDASDKGIGGVLQDAVQDSWQPLAFSAKKLQPAESRYSTFGRELLAAYLSIKHFRQLIEGKDFILYTDHKPLTYALRNSSDKYSPRELRHLDYVSQFTVDVLHIKGMKNAAADALSRAHIDVLHTDGNINLELLAKEQEVGEELQNLL